MNTGNQMIDYMESCKKLFKIQYHPAIGIFGSAKGNAEDERGIRCKEDTPIESNCCLFTLPLYSVMSTASLPQSALFETSLQYLVDKELREDDQLALFLLHEKYIVKEDSKWAAHIAVLPEQYYSIPNWTYEQLELIKGSNLYTIGGHWQI